MPTMKLPHYLWRLGWKLRAWRTGGMQVGQIFPDFSLRDISGREHRLSESSRDQKTVLWFTNLCEDCRSKIPLLEDLRQQAGDHFRILAISLLSADAQLAIETARTCGFPVLLDPEDIVTRRLGLAHPPETCPIHNLFIVNSQGVILFRHHLSALNHEAFTGIWKGLMRGDSHVL